MKVDSGNICLLFCQFYLSVSFHFSVKVYGEDIEIFLRLGRSFKVQLWMSVVLWGRVSDQNWIILDVGVGGGGWNSRLFVDIINKKKRCEENLTLGLGSANLNLQNPLACVSLMNLQIIVHIETFLPELIMLWFLFHLVLFFLESYLYVTISWWCKILEVCKCLYRVCYRKHETWKTYFD